MEENQRADVRVGSSYKRLIPRVILLAVVSIVPFLPGAKGPFIFDDLNTVVQNQSIRKADLARYLTDPSAFSVKQGNWPWRPLVLVVNSIQAVSSGFISTLPWHLFQIIMHFINALLVMLVAERAFRLKGGALAAALLFAASPLQTQAVLYISARGMVLAAAPLLLCVYCTARFMGDGEREGSKAWAAAGVASVAVALSASEGSLALLFIVPLGFYAAGAEMRSRRLWGAYLLVALVGAAFLGVRYFLLHGHVLAPNARMAPSFSFAENLALQLRYPFLMARLFFIPLHQTLLHHAPVPASALDPLALLPVAGIVAVAAALVYFRRYRVPVAGLAWYFAALLPAVVVPLNIAWAEHRTYLALPGLAIAAGWFWEELRENLGRPGGRRLAAACLVLVIVLLSALTFARARAWSSSLAVYKDAVRNAPLYDVPWSFLAHEERNDFEYDKALRYFGRAIAINPRFADAHASRSDILIMKRRYLEGFEEAKKAAELDPENGTYWNNMGTALMYMGKWELAETTMKRALELTPAYDPNRGILERNYALIQEKLKAREQSPP